MQELKKTIVIVDDHPLITDGLDSILSSDPKLEVQAKLNSGKALLNYLNSHTPDLILLDINMPDMDGIEVARIITLRYPDLKVVCISAHNAPSVYKTLQSVGISGFIPKLSDTKLITETLHKILEGGTIFLREETESMDEITPRTDTPSKFLLTKREIEIMQLIKENKSSKDIAAYLYLSPYTVDTHRKNICQKLGINNAQGLLKFAIENM